jgi:hypothetical protein
VESKQNYLLYKSLWLPNIIKTTITQYMFYIFQPHTVSISHCNILYIHNKTYFIVWVWSLGVFKKRNYRKDALRFCKQLLNFKTSTPTCMVYGELGRYHLDIAIQVRTISFWAKYIFDWKVMGCCCIFT